MSARPTNASIIALATMRLAGMKKYLTNNKTEIPVAGQILKPSDVTGVFQNSLDTRAAVTTKKAELKAARAERDKAEAARIDTDDALKGYVLNRFGVDSTEAHTFGYAPKKVAVVDVDTKQQAIVRGKATREARHTMGPKEKAKIKGTMVVLTASADPTNEAPVATTAAPVVGAVASADAAGSATQATGQPAAGVVNPTVAGGVASTATPGNGAGH
jgi:hypothetical protein